MSNLNVAAASLCPADESPSLEALPGYLLRRAASKMMGELAARLAPLDLRISHASVLLLIAERSDMTSSDIGKILEIKRANMAPLLAWLESAGLIRRSPLDRKSQIISLTELGKCRLDQVRAVTSKFENELLARIPAQHRAHLIPALQSLLV